MIYTKDFIRNKMETNDTWLYHGILAIYGLQTDSEQKSQGVRYLNGVGFNSCDAEILSSFAEQLKLRNSLSIKQKTIARKKMMKYAGQLVMIANNKE